MLKYKIVGLFNLLLSATLCFFLLKTLQANVKEFFIFPPNIILFIASTTGIFLSYLSFFQKKILPFYVLAIATFIPLLWVALLFVGFFFASDIIFLILSIILAILIFLYFNKVSLKFALFLSIVTLFASFATIASSFEEDYCQKMGEKAAKSDSTMVTATKEDAEKLKDFDVKEGSQIGVSFRTHMLCHNSFNLIRALRGK